MKLVKKKEAYLNGNDTYPWRRRPTDVQRSRWIRRAQSWRFKSNLLSSNDDMAPSLPLCSSASETGFVDSWQERNSSRLVRFVPSSLYSGRRASRGGPNQSSPANRTAASAPQASPVEASAAAASMTYGGLPTHCGDPGTGFLKPPPSSILEPPVWLVLECVTEPSWFISVY